MLPDDFQLVQLNAQDPNLLLEKVAAQSPSSWIVVHFTAAINSRLAQYLAVEFPVALQLCTRSGCRRRYRDRKGACCFRAAGNVSRLRQSLRQTFLVALVKKRLDRFRQITSRSEISSDMSSMMSSTCSSSSSATSRNTLPSADPAAASLLAT